MEVHNMGKIVKTLVLIAVLLLSFSLIGCGSNADTAKEPKKEEKSTELAKQSDQSKNTQVESTEEQKGGSEQSSDIAASTSVDNKTEQTATQANPTTQSTQTSQPKLSTAKANSAVTTNKSSAATTTKPSNSTATSTASKPNTTTVAPKPKPAATVTLSIIGPKDSGTILAASKVGFKDGDTIFDIILQTAKKQGFVVESRGSGATAYIEGINNIYEFDYGAKSGWVFKQNGVSLTKSIGVIKVKDGDRIECYYTE